MEDLMESVWPKDPLTESATFGPEHNLNHFASNEIIEIGDLLDGMSRD